MNLYRYSTVLFFVFLLTAFVSVRAQSTNSAYPTAVTSNSLNGTIAARDIGDSRMTRYFYKFTGTGGDLNIKIESENLNGSVDFFMLENMRPLSKVVLINTGSVYVANTTVYVRNRDTILLRVEARSANDDAGKFTISFDGGFEAIADSDPAPETPKVKPPANTEGSVKVNSAGARLEEPKPAPKTKDTIANQKPAVTTTASKTKNTSAAGNAKSRTANAKTTTAKTATQPATSKSKSTAKTQPAKSDEQKTDTVNGVTDTNTNAESTNTEAAATNAPTESTATTATNKTRKKTAAEIRAENAKKRREEAEAIAQKKREAKAKAEADKVRNAESPKPVAVPDPMASVKLVVETKDGRTIERTMNEVRRVNVEKGFLVVVFVDGKIEKIEMTNVKKMAIEPLIQ